MITPRLLTKYREEIVPAMMEKFGYKNPFQVPRILKVTVNMGIGKGAHEPKFIEDAQKELAAITGQKPIVTRAKKAISNFKIRKGSTVGCKVTLRRVRMYEFLDRLLNIAIPRIRDFRGLSPRGFDKDGNYTFGLTEQTVFSEIDPDKMSGVQGMNITITLTKTNKDVAYELLKLLGAPLKER